MRLELLCESALKREQPQQLREVVAHKCKPPVALLQGVLESGRRIQGHGVSYVGSLGGTAAALSGSWGEAYIPAWQRLGGGGPALLALDGRLGAGCLPVGHLGRKGRCVRRSFRPVFCRGQ